jgi:hypothetical protein
MGSANGGFSDIPRTGNPLVDAALQRLHERNDSRFRDIEDTMVVQAHLEKRMSERIKEHAAFVERHEGFIERHRKAIERHDLLMTEFDDKLNALIDIVRRRESASGLG